MCVGAFAEPLDSGEIESSVSFGILDSLFAGLRPGDDFSVSHYDLFTRSRIDAYEHTVRAFRNARLDRVGTSHHVSSAQLC